MDPEELARAAGFPGLAAGSLVLGASLRGRSLDPYLGVWEARALDVGALGLGALGLRGLGAWDMAGEERGPGRLGSAGVGAGEGEVELRLLAQSEVSRSINDFLQDPSTGVAWEGRAARRRGAQR